MNIAKKITGLENERKAVESFRKVIQSPSMYFNEEPFPRNESDEKAHRKCSNEKGKISARRAILGTGPLACVAWRFLSKLSALRKRGSSAITNPKAAKSLLYAHAILAASPLVSTKPKNRTAKLRRLRTLVSKSEDRKSVV